VAHIGHMLVCCMLATEVAIARIAFKVWGIVARGVHVLLTGPPAGREYAPACSTGGHGDIARAIIKEVTGFE
jgi:hypothetical protein